ncbi:MAG: hypothetical protein IKR48_00325, partial [Kiritimatiellae bacterium]|nr:hypothetical protein [Kiritimatiellia bacterium]
GGEAAQLRSGEAERLRSKQPEVAVTDGRDALRRVRLRNDDARVVETGKLFPMNVPVRGAGGALAYNFEPPEAAVTSEK